MPAKKKASGRPEPRVDFNRLVQSKGKASRRGGGGGGRKSKASSRKGGGGHLSWADIPD